MQVQVNLFILCLHLQNLILSASDEPEVTLTTGRVRGQKLISVVHQIYYSFRGIPYAAPPVGFLRFKAPQPPKKWNGTLEMIRIPPACSQPWEASKYSEGFNEDCLYINVFTPSLKPLGGVLMPVMVWIHGGRHYTGSSASYKYGADFLISADVVLVTFNYRLGIFGYLNTNSKSAQGNAAEKDKVAALRWIQREISQFGGDPGSVTIFGDSSGGQDVNCLYISPLAQGLFHKAISHSSPACGVSYNQYTYNPGLRLAGILGCPLTNSEEAVACLRRVPGQVLAEKQVEVLNSGFSNMLSVEEDYGEEAFLPSSAADLLSHSKSAIPYMMGINSAEGILNLQDPEHMAVQLREFENNFESYLPYSIRENATKEAKENIVKMLKSFYFGDKPISSNVNGFVNFMTDRQFTYYITEVAKTVSSHAPVYLYYFTFEGKFEHHNPRVEALNISGVSHGEEQGYLFFRNFIIPEQNHIANYPRECATLTRMVRLWTNFAKYGNPTPVKEDDLLGTTWLPVVGTRTQHLVINGTLLMSTQPLLGERVAVWQTVFNWAHADPTAGLNIWAWLLSLAVICFFIVCIIYNRFCRKKYRTIA